jgi:hypothetical protein
MEKIQSPGVERALTDEKLFSLCKMFGAQALEARRKFLGLLPEVNKREQAEKMEGRSWLARRGFPDIFVFAKKLAGASEDQVRIVLNLERRFEDKPVLQTMLINGQISVNKLARVVSIATKENQESLAEQVKILPNRAIEVLVRDVKNEQNILGKIGAVLPGAHEQDGLQMLRIDHQSPHVQTSNDEKSVTPGVLLSMKINLKLDTNIVTELNELQEKGININEILREALNNRRDQIAQEKEKMADQENANGGTAKKPSSRYISVRVKKVLAAEHGTKCSIQNCRRDVKQIHHTQRFALAKSHDPHFLAPLCKEHHLIAHSMDGRFCQKRKE